VAVQFKAASRCDTCGSADLREWLRRADDLLVLRCADCGTGVVSALRDDLDAIYLGDYYRTDPASSVGYSNYEFTSEHSVGWAAALGDALRPDGDAAVDIGCADGLLLSKLGPSFTRRAGIEKNPTMFATCLDGGLEMLAHDIYEPALEHDLGSFDLVTAVAVFEHVPEFRRAVSRAVELANSTGVLLFEVPLMSALHDNSAWLTSSLEHLYYPTLEGLRHLFVSVLDLPLHGCELHVAGYGSTFVGVTAKDPAIAEAAGDTVVRVLDLTGVPATPLERRARVHSLLVHAARSGRSEVAALASLHSSDVTPSLLDRLAHIWDSDLARRDDAEAAAGDARASTAALEQARDDAEAAATEVRALISAVEGARDDANKRAAAAAEVAESSAAREAELLRVAADWERQAHQTHEQLVAVLSASTWRMMAPVRAAVTGARRSRRMIALLQGEANSRRVRTTLRLALRGDVRTIRQRLAAVHGTAAAGAGLATAVETGPHLRVVQDPWPADLPLVTVVVVCFNYGQYVEEAVESARCQTLNRIEVIVVDGGSTDATTPAALDRLAQRHPEVRVLRRDGRHLVGDNRNFGIAAARGRYVCCLDADDLLEPIYLEVASYLLECHDYDVVSTATRTFGLREETFGLLPRPALDDMLLANNVSTVAVFRRSLWERSAGFHDTGTGPDHIHEDWKFWVRLAALGARIINITGQPLFLYRVHGEHSLSNLAGTPAMQFQRAAIAAYNADLVDDQAIQGSRARRGEVHDVEDPFRNLQEPRVDGRVTVLVTMPFLIVGGAERLISQITKHLASRGFRVIVLTTVPMESSFGDTSAWFADATAEIFHLPRLLDVNRWETFINYLIEAKNVDVLWQAGSAFVYSILPALRGEHPHLKVVDLLFNTVGHTAANRKHRHDLDLIIVENAEVERWLLAHGETPSRVVRAESGVDLDLFRPVTRRSQSQKLRVGFSGRFSTEKSPLTFIDMASLLHAREDIEFVMTGAGPLENTVRSRLARADVRGRVQLLGVVEDVREHLASLDVLVLPSKLDGRPVVVLEALALGIPVVASAVGALPELVQDGVTGFLCDASDARKFADRVAALADDRELRTKMGEAARDFAERHLDARAMFKIYEEALHRLAGC
jgi:glycosyltransferase involved in cell wall biosynthesis